VSRPVTPTSIFEICPVWDAQGNNQFHLLDFTDSGIDVEPIEKISPLSGVWAVPKVHVLEEGRRADVYFGIGHHFFFSAGAREAVATLVERYVEWLPVDSDALGRHYLIHPLRAVPLGPTSKVRCNPVSGNITVIDEFSFDAASIGDTAVFYPQQAPGSSAAEAGFCFKALMVADFAMAAIINSGLSGIQGVLRTRLDV
jgi:hypothetical protein